MMHILSQSLLISAGALKLLADVLRTQVLALPRSPSSQTLTHSPRRLHVHSPALASHESSGSLSLSPPSTGHSDLGSPISNDGDSANPKASTATAAASADDSNAWSPHSLAIVVETVEPTTSSNGAKPAHVHTSHDSARALRVLTAALRVISSLASATASELPFAEAGSLCCWQRHRSV